MESNATDKPVPREITALLSDERLILRETQRAATRQVRKGIGCYRPANAGAGTESECHLREIWRHPTPRVSGFRDPAQRTPSKEDCPTVGKPLQPRQTSLYIRPWTTGTHPVQSSGQRPYTQAASGFPHGEDVCDRWLASRIPPGEGGRLKDDSCFCGPQGWRPSCW